MDIKIRPIKKSEINECAKIIFDEFNKQGEGFTKETSIVRVRKTYSPELSLCATVDKLIVGLVIGSIC